MTAAGTARRHRAAQGHSLAVVLAGPRVEFKRADAPQLTPSMRIAMHDRQLDRLSVVDPGDRRYASGDRLEVVPLAALLP